MWRFRVYFILVAWMPCMALGVARECVSYDWQKCSGANCTQIEVCETPDRGKRAHCYATWRNETGNITVLMQGCWLDAEDCYDHKRCEEREWEKNKPYFCCCDGNMCNTPDNLYYVPSSIIDDMVVGSEFEETTSLFKFLLYTLVPLLAFSFVCAMALFIWRQCCYRESSADNHPSLMDPLMQKDETKKPIVQVHAAQFTEKLNIVAVGRFGCVWRALLGEQEVAVKIMSAQERASWQRECEIYSLPGIRDNENVLAFISAEEYMSDRGLELRIITEFHRHGSLYDYLKANELTWKSLLTISETMLRGLAFLHEEIGAKPAIAHRDFKSKNVLIKDDLTACIGDFGLALAFENGRNIGDIYSQVGTHRYMAPELLDGALSFNRDAFQRIDMYACALVLWEMVNRCTVLGSCGPYRLPYEDVVSQNPTVHALNEVVIKKGRRPIIREEWRKHEGLNVLTETIEECWDVDFEARLSACCMLDRIIELRAKTSSTSSLSAGGGDKDSACSVSFPGGLITDTLDDERKPSTGETSLNTTDSATGRSENSSNATLERVRAAHWRVVAAANEANIAVSTCAFVDLNDGSLPPNVVLGENGAIV